ncbi:hypothetical protein MRX96_019359 [Rhipicephalus microplus]
MTVQRTSQPNWDQGGGNAVVCLFPRKTTFSVTVTAHHCLASTLHWPLTLATLNAVLSTSFPKRKEASVPASRVSCVDVTFGKSTSFPLVYTHSSLGLGSPQLSQGHALLLRGDSATNGKAAKKKKTGLSDRDRSLVASRSHSW